MGVFNQDMNLFGKYATVRGIATVKDPAVPAAFTLTFDKGELWKIIARTCMTISRSFVGQKGDYNVITSKYDEYSLVYTCQTLPIVGTKLEFIWILS